jgi:hypothetical protein
MQIKTILLGLALLATTHAAKAQGFEWVHQFGGVGVDDSRSIAVDAAGNLYVAGQFSDTIDADPARLPLLQLGIPMPMWLNLMLRVI